MIETYVLPILLGLGLAASTGLRTFLPLLMLAGAAKFHLFGISLNPAMGWLASDGALFALGAATVIELIGDKIPAIDHFLHAIGFVTRPLAAAAAAYAVFGGMDPTVGAIAAVIVGAPTALAFNAAQGGTRLASTATTGGLGNPLVSTIEDGLSVTTVLIAFVAPLLIPLILGGLLWLVFFLASRVTRSPRPTPP
jgi:hypothetical protein